MPRSPAAADFSIQNLEPRTCLSTSTFYNVTDLVSDNGVTGTRTDADLVNAWGLAATRTGPWWVAAAETGNVPAYTGAGATAAPTFAIPPAPGDTEANPTGVVANESNAFVISKGANSAPSTYLVATENGTIAGWNNAVDPLNAVLAVDNTAAGAIYKGVTTGVRKGRQFLYATDFHNGHVDVFDASFNPVSFKSGTFADPNLPAGYAPFNVANIGNRLFVTFALQDAGKVDDVPGAGHGFVDVFSTGGALLSRFAGAGALDSPWAVVAAPHTFGKFADGILVGNFGDGRVAAYNRKGRFRGFLTGPTGDPLEIEGLWGLAFGNGQQSGPSNTLYFAAGPNDEAHGLFGSIAPGKKHRTTPVTTNPGPY